MKSQKFLRTSKAAKAARSRKLQVSVLVAALLCGSAYYLGERHAGLTRSAGTGPLVHTVTKLAAPGIPIAPDLKSGPGADLLARAQLENELLYTDLQSFVCDEQINRFKGRLSGETQRKIDTVTARVSFENGVEHYTDIRENSKQRAQMSSIPGAWSEGEFGTLLRQTHALLGTQPVALKGETTFEGKPAAIYTIDVPAADSPWDLIISGRSYKIPFHTDVWVSRATGKILKIQRTSDSIPPGMGISELRWSVTLDPVELDGKTWLLPKSGEYEVQYADAGRREWNVMTFSDYQRYGSRVVLHF